MRQRSAGFSETRLRAPLRRDWRTGIL